VDEGVDRSSGGGGSAAVTRADVVVAGGGLAGIAAALDCADAGLRSVLVERRPHLGGATYSIRRGDRTIDNGQHVFLRCCDAYRSLLRRIGSEQMTALQPRLEIPLVLPGGSVRRLRRTAWPAPLHLAPLLARLPWLSPLERIRAARAVLALRRLDPSDPTVDAVSLGAWLQGHGQSPATIAALWELIVRPTLNLAPQDASLAMAAKVFRTGLLASADSGDVGWARAPLGAAHGDAAARALADAAVDVRTGARVLAVERTAHGFAVETSAGVVEGDAVVVCLPPREAGAVLPGGVLDERGLARLGGSPIVNLHVVYDRPVTDLPLVAAACPPVQWVFDRTASSGTQDGQYLAVSLSAADRFVRLPVAELRALFLPALADLFPPARDAAVTDFFVTRDRRATFRAAPGTGALRPSQRTPVDGLTVAGAWTDTGWPDTMEGAVRSGRAAAAIVAERTAAAGGGIQRRAA
jgi:squalene-associated FAD-dependent desaturase